MKTIVIGVLVAIAGTTLAEGVSIPLADKVTLAVPEPFTLQRELELQPNLVRSSWFVRPDGEHLLVTLTKPDSRSCQVRLDESITLGKEFAKNPAGAQLARLDILELRTMSRRKVAYSEGATRATPNVAFVSVVSASLCIGPATLASHWCCRRAQP